MCNSIVDFEEVLMQRIMQTLKARNRYPENSPEWRKYQELWTKLQSKLAELQQLEFDNCDNAMDVADSVLSAVKLWSADALRYGAAIATTEDHSEGESRYSFTITVKR
jgi:hypothetical protein